MAVFAKNILRYFKDLSEHRTILRMQAVIFLIIASLLTLKPTATGLLLTRYNIEILPLAFLTTAISALLITWLYNHTIRKYEVLDMLRLILAISSVILIAAFVLLYTLNIRDLLVFFLYIFVSLFGLITASQFWLFANQQFTNREAKKYFGSLGVGAIAGGIFGGYLASIVTQYLNAEFLLIAAALMLIPIFPLLSKLRTAGDSKALQVISESSPEVQNSMKLIWKSKHLRYLSFIVGLSVIVARIIDYEFNLFAERQYLNEEDLTSFLAFWYSTINLSAFLVQIGLTRKVVGKVGIGKSLFVLPLLLLIGGISLLLLPALLAALALKYVDGSLKQSIQKASIELIILPIPYDVKVKTKSFIDVFVDSLATGMSGILILLVTSIFAWPNLMIIIFLLFGIFFWILLSNKVRKEYKQSFRLSLHQQYKMTKEQSERTIIDNYKKILRNGSEFQVLKTLKLLEKDHVAELKDQILELCYSRKTAVAVLAIEKLGFLSADYSKDVKALTTVPISAIRVAAYQYLISHSESLDIHYFEKKIQEPNINVRVTSLLALVKEYPIQSRRARQLDLQGNTMKTMHIVESMPHSEQRDTALAGLMRIVAYGKIKELYPWLKNYSQSANHYLVEQCMLNMGISNNEEFVELLLEACREGNPAAESAIKGLSHFPASYLHNLCLKLRDSEEFDKLELLPRAFENKPELKTVDALIMLSKTNNLAVSSKSIISLCHLLDNYPLLPVDESALHYILLEHCNLYNDLGLMLYAEIIQSQDRDPLNKLLERIRYLADLILKSIFQLLHLKYPPENIMEIYELLLGDNESVRQNAIEYLNDLLGPPLKQVLIPAIERNLLPEIRYENKFNSGEILNISELFDKIRSFHDPELDRLIGEIAVSK